MSLGKRMISTVLSLGLLLSSNPFYVNSTVEASGVAVNASNFPDAVFRKYISEFIDADGDGQLSQSETDAVHSIYIDDCNWDNWEIVKDLTGIGYFTNLDTLVCFDNQLTTLDLSKNINLTHLYCSENDLVSLDVSKNINLVELSCSGNELTSLDVSNNTKLEDLECFDNKLTSLDLSKNVNLVELGCHANNLTSLDISNNTKLKGIMCGENPLTNLDVSKNVNLTYLSCESSQLTSLDVSNNTNLTSLHCAHNKITNLDISKNTKLEVLYCEDNQLTSLDVSKNTELETLVCECNMLTSLDVSNNLKLVVLDCASNQLTGLDVSKNIKLDELYCATNNLTSLDLSAIKDMHFLFCEKNPIEELDISNNPNLSQLARNIVYATEYLTMTGEIYKDAVAWYNPTDYVGWLNIDPQTTLVANGDVLYSLANQPVPTPVPTAGPIPTVAPTPEASKSVGSFVDRCYSVALGRKADEEGYNYWLEALNNGEICGAQAGFGFIFSAEYTNKETTNEEFVTDLYSMYFGRTPDSEGFNYWVGLLNSGASREEVFAGFANSTEFDNLCSDYGVVTGAYIVGVPVAQQGGVNAFVARLYNICLTRRPDQVGQSGWVQKLIAGEASGTSCAYGFVFSPEFMGQGMTNEEFVASMYRALLGREPDEAGFKVWVETLNGIGTYTDIFYCFLDSEEFSNLCASYGIEI